jgi:hypothetical protein
VGLGRRAPASTGSRTEVEQPVVHPNEIKRLGTGQLVLLSSVPEPRVARTSVEPPPAASRQNGLADPSRGV